MSQHARIELCTVLRPHSTHSIHSIPMSHPFAQRQFATVQGVGARAPLAPCRAAPDGTVIQLSSDSFRKLLKRICKRVIEHTKHSRDASRFCAIFTTDIDTDIDTGCHKKTDSKAICDYLSTMLIFGT